MASRTKRVASGSSKPTKPKRARDAPQSLQTILTKPESKLCHMKITDVINLTTWSMLSPAARDKLAELLPPTSFKPFEPDVDPCHPSKTHKLANDESRPIVERSGASDLKEDFMTCEYFQAALTQYQDQIYSSYFSPDHVSRVQKFHKAVADGNTHVPWKDDSWDEKRGVDEPSAARPSTSSSSKGKGRAPVIRPDPNSAPSLAELAVHGLLQVGDVITYRRAFGKLRQSATVAKEMIIQSIDPDTCSLTFLLPLADIEKLTEDILTFPASVVQDIPSSSLTPAIHSRSNKMDIDTAADYYSLTASTTASALESHILPLFAGSIPENPPSHPEADCQKSFTVWRWKDGGGDSAGGDPDRPYGGRSVAGTLYYLVQSCPA